MTKPNPNICIGKCIGSLDYVIIGSPTPGSFSLTFIDEYIHSLSLSLIHSYSLFVLFSSIPSVEENANEISFDSVALGNYLMWRHQGIFSWSRFSTVVQPFILIKWLLNKIFIVLNLFAAFFLQNGSNRSWSEVIINAPEDLELNYDCFQALVNNTTDKNVHIREVLKVHQCDHVI